MAWTRTKGYPSHIRARILRRNPTCVQCGQPATIADHIIPVAEGGTDDETNGQGLCAPCHDIKTSQEQRRGLARWQARRPRQRRPEEQHPGRIA